MPGPPTDALGQFTSNSFHFFQNEILLSLRYLHILFYDNKESYDYARGPSYRKAKKQLVTSTWKQSYRRRRNAVPPAPPKASEFKARSWHFGLPTNWDI